MDEKEGLEIPNILYPTDNRSGMQSQASLLLLRCSCLGFVALRLHSSW